MMGLPKLLEGARCPLPRATARRGREEGSCRAWHALRHTFASRCRACGIPRDIISELLGHSAAGPSVTDTYLHDSPEQLQRLGAELARLWYQAPPAAAPPAPPAAPEAPAPAAPPAQDGEAEIIDFAAARAARTARRAG